ncbi:MAG: flagellar assembly protein FliW [Firmicutes bacterium]|nr:flagellar assembly protein FliW [Bacillota bacterium]
MKLVTKHFGEIDVNEKEIIYFPDGVFSFEDKKRFIIINNPNEELPFNWLQSVDDPNLAFVIINPFIFKPDYDFTLQQSVIDKLEIKEKKDVVVYCIVVIPEDFNKMTANLAAPVIVNASKMKGKQVIIDNDKYSPKHSIIEELQKQRQEE